MLLDHPIISQRYFFPRPGRPTQGAWEVPTDDGNTLVCYREIHPENHFTVVYYHGNGETPGDHFPSPAREFSQLGVNLVGAPYRGYGGSMGTPELGKMLVDTESLFTALQTPPERLVVFGRSLGSLYATEFVRRQPKVAGLILESGIADPLERLLLRVQPSELGCTLDQLRAEVDAHFNQEQKLRAYPGPVLVLHALGDELVLPEHARRNHSWAAGPKRLVLFERGDHNSILGANQARYFEEIGNFLKTLKA